MGFSARGKLISFQVLRSERAGVLRILVTRRTRRGRFYRAVDTFSTVGARVRFRRVHDLNHDGRIGFDDVRGGARVHVTGYVTKPNAGCRAPTRLRITRVTVTG